MSVLNKGSPLVSVVIPSYNASRYLREAIDSVLNQSYPYIELIVLDDGSVDNTKEILRSYPKGWFHWESHPNMGQSATLNKGWAMSKGSILSYLSADDVLCYEAVSCAVETLMSYEAVVLTYSDYILMDENGHDIRRVHTPEFDYDKIVSELVVQPGPGPFFRRRGFIMAGEWNPLRQQTPDLEYWLKLGLQGDFLRIPKVLAKFRVHNNSQSFAPATIERSEEIMEVMSNYFSSSVLPRQTLNLKDQSMSFAHIIASRSHLRAGRLRHALYHFFSAFKKNPSIILSKRVFMLMGNAVLYRFRYLLKRISNG